MAATKKFKVLEGKHIEDGKTYKKGQVVTSSRDLTKAFPLKFQQVGDAAIEDDEPATEEVTTAPKKAAKKSKKASVENEADWDADKDKV